MEQHVHKWITAFSTLTKIHQYCKRCGAERMIDNPIAPILFPMPENSPHNPPKMQEPEEPDSTVNSTT